MFTGCGMNVSLPASILEISSRSSTSRINRSVWEWMIIRYSCTSSTESSACRRRSASTNPRTAVSGVRSSWLVIATKSDLSSSSSRKPDEHLLLPGAQPGGLDDQRDLVRQATELQQALAVDRPRLVASFVQDADDGVAGPQRHDRLRRVLSQAGPRELGPGCERLAPGDEARVAPVPGVAVDPRCDQLLRASLARLQQQHTERVALHLAAHGFGDLLDALGGILGRDAGEDRRMERRQVATGLGLPLRGFLRSQGRLFGGERSIRRVLGFFAERAGEHPRDQGDDRGHAHAERDRRPDEVIAGELLRQVHLPSDLRDEQHGQRRERPQDPVSHGTLDRQEVGHDPGRVGGFGGRDPDPFEDDDGVQQEGHGADPSEVGQAPGLVHELGEEEVAEQHPQREDQAELEGVRGRVRVDTFDHGLDQAHTAMSSQRTLTRPSSSRLACSRSRLIGVSSLRAARIDGASGTARPTAPPYVLMFDTLTDRLNGVFKKLRSRGKLHPKQVDNALGEMRVALLEADVSVEVVDDLLARVRARALSEEIMKSLTPGQQIVKVVNEELTVTLGGEHHPFQLAQARPVVIMMAGVQGSGKTTACAKLALLLKGRAAGRC